MTTRTCWLIVALGLAVGAIVVSTDLNERALERSAAVDAARAEGYAEAIADVMGVVSGGGGIDEILAFARGTTAGGPQ